MHLDRLFIRVDVLRSLVDDWSSIVISYGVLAGLHVSNLLGVHQVVANEHAAGLEGALVLVGVCCVGRVHGRRVIGQVDTLRRGRQFRAESLTFARCGHRDLTSSLVLTHFP